MPKKKNNQAVLLAAKGYLSLNAVAAALGLQRQAVWKWADAGKVEHIRVAGHIYLEEKSLVLHVGTEACALLRVGQPVVCRVRLSTGGGGNVRTVRERRG